MDQGRTLPKGERFAGMRHCAARAFTSPVELEQAARLAIKENPENLPKLNAIRRAGVSLDPSKMALLTGKKWANGRTLSVQFLGGTPYIRDKVQFYATVWSDYASVKFDFTPGGPGEIRAAFGLGGGSWSYVGTDALNVPADQPTMNYGWLTDYTPDDEFRRVILHEFGHALGAFEEYQRSEGGIPWNKKPVYEYYSIVIYPGWRSEDVVSFVDREIFSRYELDQLNAEVYDPMSIMRYPVPPQFLTDAHAAVGWNADLSEGDKAFISAEYPAPLQKPGWVA